MEEILKYEKKADDDYYKILGCDENSTVIRAIDPIDIFKLTEEKTEEQIICEFKVRALDLHPDKNPDDPTTDYITMSVCIYLTAVHRAEEEHPPKVLYLRFPSGPEVQCQLNYVEKFQILQQAKEVLTEPSKRKMYDAWRKSGLAMPFDQWRNLSKDSHISMHWASKKQKDLMLEDRSKLEEERHSFGEQNTSSSVVLENILWQREPGNEVLQKFRNYQI